MIRLVAYRVHTEQQMLGQEEEVIQAGVVSDVQTLK